MDAYLSDTIASWERLSLFPQAGDRRRGGFCAGRRLRTGDDVRFHPCCGKRQIRPAGNQARHHARRRWHAAADAARRQVQGDGNVPDRPHDGRAGGRASRPRFAHRARRKLARRGDAGGSVIASMSLPIAMQIKDCINSSQATTLAEGVKFERRNFHAAFATQDQKEGMAAFVEKRPPHFREPLKRESRLAEIAR